jgi:hypothetical protein
MTDVTAEDSVQGDEQQPARDPVDQQLVDRRGRGCRSTESPRVSGSHGFEWLGLTREVTFPLAADVPAQHTRLVRSVRVSEREVSPMPMTSGLAPEQRRLEANALVGSLSMCPRGDLNPHAR